VLPNANAHDGPSMGMVDNQQHTANHKDNGPSLMSHRQATTHLAALLHLQQAQQAHHIIGHQM
jgi:hypothetical protein